MPRLRDTELFILNGCPTVVRAMAHTYFLGAGASAADGQYIPKSLHALNEDNGGCHCKANLSSLIIAPSYLKDYNNPHLRSVWTSAQKALESSSQWIFIGYSFPEDDFHIRALLLRALSVRRTKGSPATKVSVITKGEKDDPRVVSLIQRSSFFLEH